MTKLNQKKHLQGQQQTQPQQQQPLPNSPAAMVGNKKKKIPRKTANNQTNNSESLSASATPATPSPAKEQQAQAPRRPQTPPPFKPPYDFLGNVEPAFAAEKEDGDAGSTSSDLEIEEEKDAEYAALLKKGIDAVNNNLKLAKTKLATAVTTGGTDPKVIEALNNEIQQLYASRASLGYNPKPQTNLSGTSARTQEKPTKTEGELSGVSQNTAETERPQNAGTSTRVNFHAFSQLPTLPEPRYLTPLKFVRWLYTTANAVEALRHTSPITFVGAVEFGTRGHLALCKYVKEQIEKHKSAEMDTKAWIRKFLDYFGDGYTVTVNQKYKRLTQGPERSAREFLAEVRLYLTMLDKVEDSSVRDEFCTALHNSTIRKDILAFCKKPIDGQLPNLDQIAQEADSLTNNIREIEFRERQRKHERNSSDSEQSDTDSDGRNKKKQKRARQKERDKSADSVKYCSTHGSGKHSTEECKHPRQQRKKEASQELCIHCKRKKTHEPDDCWSLEKNKHKVPNWYNNKTQHKGKFKPSILAISKAALPDLFDERFAYNVRTEAETHALKLLSMQELPPENAKQSSSKNSSSSEQKAEGIQLKVNINFSTQNVVLDTGAVSCSFITQHKAEELKLHVDRYTNTVVMGWDYSVSKPIGRTKPVLISSGLHMTLASFVVVEKLSLGDIIIGLPESTHLQLISWNLPNPLEHEQMLETELKQAEDVPKTPGNKILNLVEEEIETCEFRNSARAGPHPNDAQQVKELLEDLAPVIEDNQKITDFLKAPEVSLELLSRQPIWLQQYGVPEAAKQAVRDQIAKWLGRGKIRKSKSSWNLPLTTAVKKDEWGNVSGTRVCIDPRAINKILINDGFPIPNIRQIFDSFKGKRYFTEIDLEDAFLQLKLAKKDEEVLSFTWEGQQYSFVGCPYGLKIMSNVFQRTIQGIFADLDFVKVYIDNVSIASSSWHEHCEHVKIVLKRMNEYNLRLSPKKLKLGRRAIRLLGQEISSDGIRPDPRKVSQIKAWPFPANVKTLKSFLGVVGYLRPHIRHFPGIAKALTRASVDQAAYDREVALNRDSMQS